MPEYDCYLELVDSERYLYRFHGKIKNEDGNKTGYNIFTDILRKFNLVNNKHIPHVYKCNSRENRLRLLAGLIDTDGSLDTNRDNSYDFIQKNYIEIID